MAGPSNYRNRSPIDMFGLFGSRHVWILREADGYEVHKVRNRAFLRENRLKISCALDSLSQLRISYRNLYRITVK